ncbi:MULTISPECIES: viral A-type inclusion protein [unclassified Clostridium]|uniref:viral A-type inclusion protein n=1 Tax=unclassified Clostridium TaxID=2614128 RepID=UPI002079E064|nr:MULTISPECIES: viral A-type inclusion protein [unclassified Clostridium]
MIQELQTERLDINNKYDIDFSCKQLDDIILKIIVYDKSIPANLGDYTCRLKAFKRDQVPLIQNTNITIKDNVVTIKADKQLTTTNGIVKAELQFINKTTLEKKSTFYINIEVVASVLDVDGIVSTPTCTILEEIDHKLDEIENIGQVLDEAKDVRDTLTNTTIPTATSINSKLETNINNADVKITEVENIISIASNKIEEVETCINNADSSKKELNLSKTNADISKENLDTANVQAEKNIEELNKIGDAKELATKVETNKNNIESLQEDVENNTSQLKDCAKKDGILQIGLNAEKFNGKTINDLMQKSITISNTEEPKSLNQPLTTGIYWGMDFTDGFPEGYTNVNDFVLLVYGSSPSNTRYAKHILIDIRSDKLFERMFWNGEGRPWKQLATTEEIDLTNTLRNGWQHENCSFRAKKMDNELFVEGIIFNNLQSPNNILAQLPAPKDGRWHGGSTVGNNNTSLYLVVNPLGTLMFQSGGQVKDKLYSINIHYPI